MPSGKKLSTELSKLEPGHNALLTVSSENYLQVKEELIKYLAKKEKYGIYVTLNRTAKQLVEEFEKLKVDTSRMVFIDAITEPLGGETVKLDNTIFISSTQNLTDLGIEIIQVMEARKENFLVFDAVTTLLLYHKLDVVGKFFHVLATKIRENKVKGFFLNVDDEAENPLTELISQFCDKSIFLNK